MDFNEHASDYDGNTSCDPLKSFLGGTFDSFVLSKTEWLKRNLRKNKEQGSWLDFGCGTGELLISVAGLESFRQWNFIGYDEAEEMIHEALARYSDKTFSERLIFFENINHLVRKNYDIITIINVLHHVPQSERFMLLNMLKGLLKYRGCLVVIEHNPYNPITRYVVSRAPIDVDAILLKPKEIKIYSQKLKMDVEHFSYLLFLPPRLKFFRGADNILRKIPVGGQYGFILRK